jgi:hypothetical protein
MKNKLNELTKSMAQSITRRSALKKLSLGLAGVALARFGVNQAHAITNGQLDGDGHPNVCGFVWLKNIFSLDPPPVFIGSGSLIHPRVVLTAGHGTYAVEAAIAGGLMTIDELLISFASDATNPATWRQISAVITHPSYFDPPNGNSPPLADIGVAILKEPITNLPLMPLPPVGFLDGLQAAGALVSGPDGTRFTVVGYGAVLGEDPHQILFPPDGLRRFTESAFSSLHERWLYLDIKPVQDLGGDGAGDSGGPTLWRDPLTGESTLVAVNSRGNLSLDSKARVDTEETQDFLNDIIARVDAGEL